jgi:hypothetical protein
VCVEQFDTFLFQLLSDLSFHTFPSEELRSIEIKSSLVTYIHCSTIMGLRKSVNRTEFVFTVGTFSDNDSCFPIACGYVTLGHGNRRAGV